MSRPPLIFTNSLIPYPGDMQWRAAINYVTDGDTCWVERDSGCRSTDLIELRITGNAWRGWNAKERFTAEGKQITALFQKLAPPGTIVLIETQPDTEKYGRWLSPVLFFAPNNPADWKGPPFIVDDLVQRGNHAYIDWATYAYRVLPGCSVWQTY